MANIIRDQFTEYELLVVLEGFREAMADAETYDSVAKKMDLSDEFLKPLIEKVQHELNTR